MIALLFDPFAGNLAYHAGQITLMFLASILLIPYPAMHERGFNLFSLNAPSWSLFWEYVANIFVPGRVVVYRFTRRWLLFFTVFAAVVLCVVGYRAGMLAGGWNGGTFWDGGARVAIHSGRSAGLPLQWITARGSASVRSPCYCCSRS